jgi:hypothetical protein
VGSRERFLVDAVGRLELRVHGSAHPGGATGGEQFGHDQPGRHEQYVALHHRGRHLVVEVGAVLDRDDPGLDRGEHPRLAVAVRHHAPLGHPRHLDDRAQFRERELLVDRMVALRQHPAGRAHLDDGRTLAQLLTDRRRAGVDAVAQPEGRLVAGQVVDPPER